MHIPRGIASIAIILAATLAPVACGDDDNGDPTTSGNGAETNGTDTTDAADAAEVDDRDRFRAEMDGVTAVVADCYVSEASSDGRRTRTTVEVTNRSPVDRSVTVTIEGTGGRGGTGPTIDVPAGASDAWSVVSESETTDPEGDVVCADYITAITLTLDDAATGQSP